MLSEGILNPRLSVGMDHRLGDLTPTGPPGGLCSAQETRLVLFADPMNRIELNILRSITEVTHHSLIKLVMEPQLAVTGVHIPQYLIFHSLYQDTTRP